MPVDYADLSLPSAADTSSCHPRQRLPVRVGQGKGGSSRSGHGTLSSNTMRKLNIDTHH